MIYIFFNTSIENCRENTKNILVKPNQTEVVRFIIWYDKMVYQNFDSIQHSITK